MLNAKKWLAMLLTVSLLFNFIPMNTLAVEPADSVGDPFADAFLEALEAQGMMASIVKGSDGVVTLTIEDKAAAILALLSQQTQTADANYQNWNIYFNITGTLDLTGTDYQGLGDSEYPFQGNFTGNINGIKSSKTIFKALSVDANLKGVQITWVGAKDIPILAETLTATADTGVVNMPLASATSFSPYIGTLNGGAGLVTLPVLDYSGVDITKISTDISTGNLGLIINTMDAGTQVQVGTLRLPEKIDLRGTEDVGGLVGYMKNNAVLNITQSLNLNLYLSGQNTGGLVGNMDCASIQFASSAGVTINAELDAEGAAGGIAGVAKTVTGPLNADANVVLESVKTKGNDNAGVLYGSCTATDTFDPFVGVANWSTAEVSGNGSCGGMFGTLTLSENGKCTIGATGSLLEINSTLTGAGNATKYGGIAGTLTGTAGANALVMDNCNVTANVAVGNDTANYPKYLGGIVAVQETITLDTKESTITVTDPKTYKDTDRGFGGVCAYLGAGALLIADTIEIETTSYAANPGGGGVVGSAHEGSIVYLKNSIDLSKCQLSTNATTGQIVGSQECSLIYAPGVNIYRLKTGSFDGMEMDDIGNYGELYRLENLMSVGDDYAVRFPQTLSKTGEAYVLSTALDYACLALAWQSRGYFLTVNGITNTSWEELKSSTITLGADIDLTDLGIGGLTRDVDSDDDTFTGTLNGAGYEINLDIGSKNSANDVAKGDGQIYWHNATGLFAVLDSNANVMNLTMDGNIRLSNNKLGSMHSGGLSALMKNTRNNKDSALSAVSTNVTFDVNANGANQLYIGGLIGLISNADTTIEFKDNTALKANINISHSVNGIANHFAGAIGGIAKDATVTITCDGATLSGQITSKGTTNNLYAGGLVGTIFPSDSKTRAINITSLNLDGFTFTGNASERMGGILGGIWAAADVNMDGLSVTNTKLTANGNAELGGLVYRASGKWKVSSVKLSGLTIDAGSAKALGLLVCHGEPYQEPINGTSSVGGLYLEMTKPWSSGYSVPSINTFSGAVFDEFVAYTAYREQNTTNYQITHNGGGIISLKTENGTVNMTEGERNTYINRTTVGLSKQTNPNSRYYYNLPEVISGCDGRIDTANELLIWSVYRYAASNLKENFSFNGVETGNIGGTSPTTRANFNMNGLSYYPIDLTNESISVQYADVTFYNNDIENKENNNKSTRENDGTHSQHYAMHCGLFANYNADLRNDTISKTYEMKVNGVTFAGTVGVVDGGSGALLCGTVKGESREGKTAICNVILADADEASKGVSLNGLSVMPEGDYTPALINCFESYSGLETNYVTTTANQTDRAGSSLIGNVGGENATNVKIAFAGTIRLPETGVFTKATLLNSLRYANGSATYNFTKAKDYQEDTFIHNTTHGKELSESVEYEGKCGYYDDDTDNTLFVVVGNGKKDFSGYLPYVALSPAMKDDEHSLEKGWHELAVNIHFEPLKIGCGTYGHPYQVTAKELREAAGFINTGVAATGWTVRVCSDPDYHTNEDEHDCLLTYQNGGWKNADNNSPYEGNVREYLQNAYYQLVYAKDENGIEETSITLSNFQGIGTTSDWAFKGVITGKQSNGTNATVTLTSGSAAFIKYSYGSVVRDVNIVLDQSVTINRPTWTRGNAEQAPKTFFGGAIGCVLGGDNIIENVNVSTGSEFSLSASGTNPHLIPIGGYVGAIAGGGVIFRGTCNNTSTIAGSDEGKYLYRNPIIGRVLGGYAFYEGSGTVPDNGDKNYKINRIILSDAKDLSWDGSTLTVNSAQGLLLLSAIVSSGAGSADSNAYFKGVARNAKYDCIGQQEKPEDYDIAENEAKISSLSKYVSVTGENNNIGKICTSSTEGITLKFAVDGNGNPFTFDMGNYGNGYRALSARYVSNAAFKDSTINPYMVVLRIKTFDGQNATVKNISMEVKEYNNDDFHAASLGGIFNIVWTQKQSGGGGDGSDFVRNLTLQDCNVSLKYVSDKDVEQNQADANTLSDADGRYCVSVGGFIGMANDIDADSNSQKTVKHNYLFTNISIKSTNGNTCQIYGPNGVGGLIGTTAMASTGVSGYPGKLLANGKWALFGPNFLNCSYSNIEVTGGLASGGLIGDAYASGSGTVPGFSSLGISYGNKAFLCYASCTVTQDDLIVGQDSTITARAKGSIAAGIFGAAGMRVGVNDPDVASADKTNLPISGEICKLRLSDVDVLVSQTDFESASNPDGNKNNAYAGGIIARIGSVNPSCFYNIDICGGKINSEKATGSYVGGVVGSGYTNSTIKIQGCHISGNEISGVYAGGFLGRGHSATNFSLSMTDCSIKDSTVTGSSYAGGLLGSASSKYYLYNILIKNTSIKAKNMNNAGRLFGLMNFNNTGNDFYVYAAGISVYVDKDTVTIPSKEGCTSTSYSYIGYISYADYAGTETSVNGEEAPYITVNPNFTLAGADKLLTGDAVGRIDGDSFESVAARIWEDQKTGAAGKKNLASYIRASAIVNADGKAAPEVSTFQAVQGCGPDLPVLVLKGGDAGVITDYLNVITNGGYSEAPIAAQTDKKNKVETKVTVYYYDETSGNFSIAEDIRLQEQPASVYYDNGIKVRGNSYDNTRYRFSLVEASFDVQGSKYTVSIPVVVIRELQYNFMATFSYGAEFHADTYTNLRTHVLESTGNPFAAYLTYEYNREQDEVVDYDWQSYMDSGGNMLAVDKILTFSSGLPVGTQMTLIDCQDGNQAYFYETTTAPGTGTSVRLSDFTAVSDETKKFRASMADILDVVAAENVDGKYVVETDPTKATLRLQGTCYRLYQDGDETTRYSLTVPDLSKDAPRENYYLVITVPEQDNPDFYINGGLSSSLKWEMPSSGTQVHRYDGSTDGVGNNDESTYQISTGYRQDITSLTESGEAINMITSEKNMQVYLKDTITFSNQQAYGNSDQLFVKFDVSLQEHTSSSTVMSERQFPAGTTGTVHFLIQDSNGNYYAPSGSSWSKTDTVTEAASYPWTSRGANMELLVSVDGTTALDLAGVRQMIKESQSTGSGNIIITAKMEITFSSQEVLNAAIPGSAEHGTDIWASLHYVGRISTQANALDYSANRKAVDDNAKYYRGIQYQAVLSMDASQIDQLGINPLELVPKYLSNDRKTSQIDLIASLDLENLPKAEEILQQTASIRFDLELLQRDDASYIPIPTNEETNYISFNWLNQSDSWSWTISQDQFYADGKIILSDLFDGEQFTIPLTAYVSTVQKNYSNYKIQLKVSFLNSTGESVSVALDDKDAYVVYTFACIRPSFYEPKATAD